MIWAPSGDIWCLSIVYISENRLSFVKTSLVGRQKQSYKVLPDWFVLIGSQGLFWRFLKDFSRKLGKTRQIAIFNTLAGLAIHINHRGRTFWQNKRHWLVSPVLNANIISSDQLVNWKLITSSTFFSWNWRLCHIIYYAKKSYVRIRQQKFSLLQLSWSRASTLKSTEYNLKQSWRIQC